MYSDPIADYLTRLRNASSVGHESCVLPFSKVKAELSRVLKEEGYIADFESKELENNKKELKLTLKYHNGESVIDTLKRISKTSCRIYVAADEIPAVRSGLGISVISTSKGLMTGRSARKANLGGELLCKVW